MEIKSLFLILVITLCTPFVAEADSGIWCTGDSQKVKPYDKFEESNFFWDEKERTVRLQGAKNEYVAFQIVIYASGENLQEVNVKTDNFRCGNHIISEGNIDLFRQHYLKVAVPSSYNRKPVEDAKIGEYPTQMIPFTAPKFGAPFNVENGRNQPIWVDLYIPEDVMPGEYRSLFTITAKEKEPIKIKVILEVWDFMLPHETHFRTYIYYGSEQIRWAYGYKDSVQKEFRVLEGKFFQMARQHRLNLCPNLEMDWGYDNFEKYWDKRGRGKFIDGSAYTERVGKGVPANAWIVLIDDFDHKPEYQRLVRETVKFFREKGLDDKLILYVYDEPRSKNNYDFIRIRCKWAHEVAGKILPCMVTAPIKSPHFMWGSLIGYVDIWNSGDSSWKDMQKRMKAGDKIWTYNMGWGGGPYVDTPGISGRTQAWVGWKFDFDGWMFWDSCYWIDVANNRDSAGKKLPWNEINSKPYKHATEVWLNPLTFDQMKRPGYLAKDAIRLNGDGVLFYPGKEVGLEEPISSFVMKSLRRGLQDYEYLWLAKSLNKEKEIMEIVNSVIPAPKQWNKNVNVWYEARLKLANIILGGSKQKKQEKKRIWNFWKTKDK